MPYAIRKLPNKDLYRVYNSDTKVVHSYSTTLENAEKQVKLLHMVDAGVPLKKQGGEITNILKPFFNRVGSKVSLLKDIIPIIPPHTTYVEPFIGGGAIFWNKTPAEKSVINDLDKELITGYKILKRISPKTDLTFLDNAKQVDGKFPAVEKFIESITNNSTDGDKLLRIMKLSNGTFNSKGIGHIYKNPSTESKMNNISEYKKLLKPTTILNKDYLQVIKEYDSPTTFFFLDPPYENTADTYYRNSIIDYNVMNNALKNIKGKFLLTINDSKLIRDTFKDFKIKTIVVKNPANTGFGEETRNRKELFISNYNMKSNSACGRDFSVSSFSKRTKGGSVETDNFEDKGIVSIPEFRSVNMTLPTYMYKRLPNVNGKPPQYKYKLVIPITSSRNISSRKKENSIIINQKPVAKAIINIDKNKEKPLLDDFSPDDIDKLTDYYDKVAENEDKTPDEIQNDSYKIVPRGKPLPCINASKKGQKSKKVVVEKVKEPSVPKGKRGRPKKAEKEIVLNEYEETGSYEPPEEEDDTLDKEDEDLLLNNYEEFKKKYGLISKKGKGLEIKKGKGGRSSRTYVGDDNEDYTMSLEEEYAEEDEARRQEEINNWVEGYRRRREQEHRRRMEQDRERKERYLMEKEDINRGKGLENIVSTDNIKMPNKWVEYVKSYSSKNNMSYRDALRDPNCKAGYKKEGAVVKRGKGVVDELGNQELLAEKYNGSQLGANAGKKYISL